MPGLIGDRVARPPTIAQGSARWLNSAGRLPMAANGIYLVITAKDVANGARANMKLGTRGFLVQQNWVNAGTGGCVLRA